MSLRFGSGNSAETESRFGGMKQGSGRQRLLLSCELQMSLQDSLEAGKVGSSKPYSS